MDRCSNKRGRSNEDKSVRVEGDHGSTNIAVWMAEQYEVNIVADLTIRVDM